MRSVPTSAVRDAGASSGRRSERRVDRRLLELSPVVRASLVATVAVGIAAAVLVVAQAAVIAAIIEGSFVHHEGATALRGRFVLLAAVVAMRAAATWGSQVVAHHGAAAARSAIRRSLLERLGALGSAGLVGDRSGSLAALATQSVDALDGYFTAYLPQVVLAVIVPVVVVAVLAGADWLSAVLVAVTVPLVPVFMVLIGAATAERTTARAAQLARLAGTFIDVIAGLPTLKAFRRQREQAVVIANSTARFRVATMATLRLAFLSSLVLELLATVSVAVVAVAVGLRLLSGHLSLSTAFFVLLLAPEAYLPLRALGASFHASADGRAAAVEVFEVLDRPVPPARRSSVVPHRAAPTIEVEHLEVRYDDRATPALCDLSMSVAPGEVVAVCGRSGAGKSTLLRVLLGLAEPSAGTVTVSGVDLTTIDAAAWHEHVAWVPQRPHLLARTLAENVRLGSPRLGPDEVAAAIEAAGLADLVRRLPAGLDTNLGADGATLSVGERQRVALARAFARDAPLVLLDEPTASLDGQTERAVLDAVGRLMTGRTVVIAAHRSSLVAMSDRVVTIPDAVHPR